MKNSLISILSACSTHQCLAFASSAFSGRLVSSSSDDVLPHASSARWSCSKAPGRRHRPHQRRQRSLLRAAEEEGGGVAEGGDGAGDVNGGAGSGMGLDGEWQVKSGRGRKARASEGVGSVPGQLPEKTRDGQDWAEWAREWREDPQGKADRLVGQWEAEAEANGSSQGSGRSTKRNSKKNRKNKKGSAGPARGVVGSGFGGAARPTKSVPKGLVVAETGAGTGDVVDWSTGQQLTETDRKDNMAADWQQDAKHLESLDPSDREKLAEKLRMALGKKKQQQKPKKKAPPGVGDGRGFSSSSGLAPPAGGKRAKKGGSEGGDGRGVLASAAAAAGAVVADDVAGVSVFPSIPAEAPAAASVGQSGGEQPLAHDADAVVPVEGASKGGEEDAVLGGGASFGDGIETEASNDAQIPAPAATAVEEEEVETPGTGKTSSPGDEKNSRKGGEIPLERVMGFGKGVAVVEAGGSGSEDPSRASAGSSTEGFAGSSAGFSVDEAGKLAGVRNFGRGVAVPTEEVVEVGREEEPVAAEKGREPGAAAADDGRLSGFGRGVAFPME